MSCLTWAEPDIEFILLTLVQISFTRTKPGVQFTHARGFYFLEFWSQRTPIWANGLIQCQRELRIGDAVEQIHVTFFLVVEKGFTAQQRLNRAGQHHMRVQLLFSLCGVAVMQDVAVGRYIQPTGFVILSHDAFSEISYQIPTMRLWHQGHQVGRWRYHPGPGQDIFTLQFLPGFENLAVVAAQPHIAQAFRTWLATLVRDVICLIIAILKIL